MGKVKSSKNIKSELASRSQYGLRLRDVRSRSSKALSILRRHTLALFVALALGGVVIGVSTHDRARAVTPPATLGVLSYQKYQTINLTDRAKLLVNVANGNLIVQTNDANLKSVGPSLNVTRFFNDQATGNGQLGSHTTLSVGGDISVTANSDGSATYNGPSGFKVTYPSNGSGGYTTPASYTDAKLAAIAGGGWTLTFNKNGEVYTFNAAGKQTKHANADGLAINYAYNADGTLNTATDAQGKTLNFTNYSGTKVGKISDSTGRYSTYSYTGDQLTSSSDAAGNGWQYQYYDGRGNVNQITDPRGYTTTLSYDNSNRVTRIKLNDYTSNVATYTYAYNNNSAQTVLTDPNSHNTTFTYDASGRVTATLNAVGSTNSATWDINNNQTAAIDSSNYATTSTYDTNNNLTKVQNPTLANGNPGASDSYSYTNTAHPYLPASRTDAQGNITSYSYNTNGNLTQSSTTGAGSQSYKIQGDPDGSGGTINCSAKQGQVCSSTDARGNTTTYTYDTLGNVLSVVHPSPQGTDSYTYDNLSRVKTHTDGKGTVATYTYDSLDHVTTTAYSDGTNVSQNFNADGAVTQRFDAAGTTTYTLDGFNRTTKMTQSGKTDLNYTYDGVGNLLTESGPAGTTTYIYDGANQIATLSQSANQYANISYAFTDGRPTAVYLPGGITQTIGYDRAGRQTSVRAVRGTTVLTDYTATYMTTAGADKELMQSEKNNLTGVTTTYGYDNLNRLTSTSGSTGTGSHSYTYAYDANGNRTQYSKDGSYSAIFGYNAANQLTTAGGANYGGYDGTGNQTSNGAGLSMGYNVKNQATAFTPSGGSTSSAGYMGSSQTGRTSLGSTTYQNGLLGLYGETTVGSSIYYAHLPTGTGQTVSQMLPGNTPFFYLTDIHGSTVAMTDVNGNVTNTYAYDPYGITLSSTGTTTNKIQFQNAYLDTSTNLYKMGARYYNPVEGRFTQVDPSGQDFYYNFAGLDPVNFSDPSGYAKDHYCFLTGGVPAIYLGGQAAYKVLVGSVLIATGVGAPIAAAVGVSAAVDGFGAYLFSSYQSVCNEYYGE